MIYNILIQEKNKKFISFSSMYFLSPFPAEKVENIFIHVHYLKCEYVYNGKSDIPEIIMMIVSDFIKKTCN